MASLKTSLPVILKTLAVLVLLYVFVCSLDLLSSSFRLLAGRATGSIFDARFLNSMTVQIMIGILGTVAVQSSSTFTSIIISMVTSGIVTSRQAVPMVMGANIGTSVTNTIVSLTQISDREQFRRAFSAATVHDMFNWSTVIVLLILEATTGIIFTISEALSKQFVAGSGGEIEALKLIVDPVVDLIVQVNSDALKNIAEGKCEEPEDCLLLKKTCDDHDCVYFFNLEFFHNWQDWQVGAVLLALSLFLLIMSLLFIVKLLSAILKGAIASLVKKVLNPHFENPVLNYLYGYVNIVVGALATLAVQSSSVFTSTFTPLVGVGLIELETAYPLFLGSNLGTTGTGLLAALSQDGDMFREGLQAALVHLLFNTIGILIFYPLPFFRPPIRMCKILGNTTAKYRWFAIAYLIVMFILLPLFVMLTSLNNIVFIATMVPLAVILFSAILINVLQSYDITNRMLPNFLRSWDFLPDPLHKLSFWDRVIAGWSCCKRFSHDDDEDQIVMDQVEKGGNEEIVEKGIENPTFNS